MNDTGEFRVNGANKDTTATIPALSEGELAKLEGLSKPELIALIRRACLDKARVMLMGEEEQAKAMLDTLAIMALTSDDDKAVLNAIREWLDRKQGKPAQYIRQDNVSTVNVLVNRVRDELRALDTETILEMKRLIERKQNVVIENEEI
jgi:hypothetical protein